MKDDLENKFSKYFNKIAHINNILKTLSVRLENKASKYYVCMGILNPYP